MTPIQDLENWMGKLPEEVRQSSGLQSILLPASHQSAAFKFDYKASTKRFSWIPRIRHNFEADNLCQELNLTQQLRAGIRHFEFQLAKVASDSSLYVCHQLPCIPAMDAIREIVSYLDHHKGELVVLRLEADAQLPSVELETFLLHLDVYYDYILMRPPASENEPSIEQLCKSNKRLLISCAASTTVPWCWNRNVGKAVAVIGHLSDKMNVLPLASTQSKNDIWRILSLAPKTIEKGDTLFWSSRRSQKQFLIEGYRSINFSQFHAVEANFPHPKFIEYIIRENYRIKGGK